MPFSLEEEKNSSLLLMIIFEEGDLSRGANVRDEEVCVKSQKRGLLEVGTSAHTCLSRPSQSDANLPKRRIARDLPLFLEFHNVYCEIGVTLVNIQGSEAPSYKLSKKNSLYVALG